MEIRVITHDNTQLLNTFLECKLPPSFRYFNSRSVDVIKNHIITIIGIIDDTPVAYGHLDNDTFVWLGVCVLDGYQGRKLGTQIVDYLISHARTSKLNVIKLSVDIDNHIAIKLYNRSNFIHEHGTIMSLNIQHIHLPVSLGEALDKLTILDIKLNKLTDDTRKIDVRTEFNSLMDKLKCYKQKYSYQYSILKLINLDIWEMQDEFRDSTDDHHKVKLCQQIIVDNDRRFRVKKKINTLAQSSLKEQKGYKPLKACILTHLGVGDHLTAIGAIRYFSTCYDELYVISKRKYHLNLELFFSDDDSIKIVPVEDDMEAHKYIRTLDMPVLKCGLHCGRTNFDDLPFCFYDDLGLDKEVFWQYFNIPTTNKATALFESVKDVPYVFIHNTASNGKVFDGKRDELMINPNENMYTRGDAFYELAESFVGEYIIHYKLLIENADMNIMTDSSFMCMAINLDVKTDKNYYITRDDRNYDHLWAGLPITKFTQVKDMTVI